jgi:hypothetical protein
LGDPLWFFTHLGGFDHAACDAALRAKHVAVTNINLGEGPIVAFGFVILAGFFCTVQTKAIVGYVTTCHALGVH